MGNYWVNKIHITCNLYGYLYTTATSICYIKHYYILNNMLLYTIQHMTKTSCIQPVHGPYLYGSLLLVLVFPSCWPNFSLSLESSCLLAGLDVYLVNESLEYEELSLYCCNRKYNISTLNIQRMAKHDPWGSTNLTIAKCFIKFVE